MRCTDCAKIKRELSFESQEVAHLRKSLHRASRPDLADALLRQQAQVVERRRQLDEHQATCEAADTPKPPPTSRRIKVDDGREPCPVCRRPCRPKPDGYLRKHNDPDGYPCTNRDAGRSVVAV